MYISTRERDRLNKLKKQQQKTEDAAALKICKQKMLEHSLSKKPSMPEEPEFIQRYCPCCNNLLSIRGKLKKLVGKEFECSVCHAHFIVLDPFPKKPGMLSRIMDGFSKIYEEEQIQKEKNSDTWIKIGGFLLGAYIGLNAKQRTNKE